MATLPTPILLLITFASLFILPCSYVLASLVPSPSTKLQYHNGPLLSSPINIYITWYGSFSTLHKDSVSDFFASFTETILRQKPTVSAWWSTVGAYKDATGKPVSRTVKLTSQAFETSYPLGKALSRAALTSIVKNAIAKRAFPLDSNGVYLVLTASDVAVDRFCMDSCGFHTNIVVFPGKRVVIAHVGDPAAQCPGLCAWPYAIPANGPPGPPLVAPNGIGVDGMIMNIATVLSGAATNPSGTGYYQGDRSAPLEAVTACPGIFGADAYPGYPGELMLDGRSKASFNVYGTDGRMYLLPAIWDPVSWSCKVV